MKTNLLALLALTVCLAGQTAFAQSSVPSVITYQGRVTVGGQPFTGTGQFKFALVNGGVNASRTATATAGYPGGVFNFLFISDGGAGYITAPTVTFVPLIPGGSGGTATATIAGGAVTGITINNYGTYTGAVDLIMSPPPANVSYASYWSHDNTSAGGSQPTSAVTLPVANGLFVVPLGDTNQANMNALPANVVANDNVHLRIWFNDGTNGFAQLTPDQPLTAAPYALLAQKAAQLEGVSTGPVTLNNAANIFSGNGAGLTAVNASTVGGLAVASLWRTDGNAGTTTTNFLGTTDSQPLVFKVNGQPLLRLETNSIALGSGATGGYFSTALGHFTTASGYTSTALGYFTTASGNDAIALGHTTTAGGNDATALGWGADAHGVGATALGFGADAYGNYSTALGNVTAIGSSSTAMGNATTANGSSSTAMGDATTANGFFSTAMGRQTIASGNYTVALGYRSTAIGDFSFAAGYNARAAGSGSFVWSSYVNTNVVIGSNQFSVFGQHGFNVDYFSQRPDGGGDRWVYIGDNIATHTITAWNTAYLSDGGQWVNGSDKNRKTDFVATDVGELLSKLVALPVRQWRYTNENSSVKHVGPTSQDFRAAFGLGTDDKSIGTLDESGVALAAIQGLNQKLEGELKTKDSEIQELQKAVAELQQAFGKLTQQTQE